MLSLTRPPAPSRYIRASRYCASGSPKSVAATWNISSARSGSGVIVAIGDAVQAVHADRDESVGNRADVAPVDIVLVVALDQLLEIFIGDHVVARHEFAGRVHAAELPTRERLAALGGVGQRAARSDLASPALQVVDAGAQSFLRAGECLGRNLGRRISSVGAVERQDGGRPGDGQQGGERRRPTSPPQLRRRPRGAGRPFPH